MVTYSWVEVEEMVNAPSPIQVKNRPRSISWDGFDPEKLHLVPHSPSWSQQEGLQSQRVAPFFWWST